MDIIELTKSSKLAQALKKLMPWMTWEEIAGASCSDPQYVLRKWKERVNDPEKIEDLKKAVEYLEESTVLIAIDEDGNVWKNGEKYITVIDGGKKED